MERERALVAEFSVFFESQLSKSPLAPLLGRLPISRLSERSGRELRDAGRWTAVVLRRILMVQAVDMGPRNQYKGEILDRQCFYAIIIIIKLQNRNIHQVSY